MHLLAHLVIVLLLISVIYIAQYVLRRLGDPYLLDFLPLRYIFDVMDIGLSALFLVFGTISTYHAFKEGENE